MNTCLSQQAVYIFSKTKKINAAGKVRFRCAPPQALAVACKRGWLPTIYIPDHIKAHVPALFARSPTASSSTCAPFSGMSCPTKMILRQSCVAPFEFKPARVGTVL